MSGNVKPLEVVLLLGGEGARFASEGYLRPKVLVTIHGRPMVYWVLKLLDIHPEDHITIAYHKRLSEWQFEDVVRHAYPSLKADFLAIEFNTRGAVESGLIACKKIASTAPVVFLDGDSLHTENVLQKARDFFYGMDRVDQDKNSLALFCKKIPNPPPIFSFVRFDEQGTYRNGTRVTDIAEKQVISDNMCIGIYCFPNVHTFRKYALKVIDEGVVAKGEFYMSQVYARALKDPEMAVYGINVSGFISVGTPLQVWEYLVSCKSDPNAPTSLKGLRVCFDLDNTLVTYPKVKGDYTTVEPIPRVIAVARQLKEAGCEIIIHTARRMATFKDNVGKVIKDQAQIVLNTLEKFGIPYDELHFGKPLADFYIDDRAVNPFCRLHEELGIPNEHNPSFSHATPIQEARFIAIPPRSFHNLKITSETVAKIGHAASMEPQTAYYKNIPPALKDYFPSLISENTECGVTTLTLSRARGAPLSYVYIFGTLTMGLFDEVISSITALHDWKPTTPEDLEKYRLPTEKELYLNWAPKVHERWDKRKSDCYCNFKGSDILLPRIIWWLEQYEKHNMGVAAHVVHGDAVFTNCIVAAGKPRVKWVDMRGQLGSDMVLCGDANYDWAKVLQSVLGYDYVLLGKPNMARSDYPDLLPRFEEFYVKRFGKTSWAWLWVLAASFMFSLLPLHLDQPVESQTFYRMGATWLQHAEELLESEGITYAGDDKRQPQRFIFGEIFGEEIQKE